jgi:tetratricopeptide (TPR) repeat protein
MALPRDSVRTAAAATPARTIGFAALLVLATVIAYLPTLHNGFVWDDGSFLTANPLIKAPDGLRRFWLTTEPTDYWPVTSSTLWLEWRLWGGHAAGYHATNLVLHVTEVLLLWAVLRRLRLPGATLAALLFAVHPVNVESVAWVAQRKNLMAMLFFLLSILAFLRTRWSEAGTAPPARPARTREAAWYAASLAAFVLALLSKGSVAPLPLVLLGIIAWRRPVDRRDASLLVPFFLVAAVLAAVNVWFQTHGTHEIIREATGLQRLLGAAAAVWFYLYKAVVPFPLVFVYPQWRIDPGNPAWWLPLAAAVALTGVLWRLRRPAPAGLFAWGYFCVMLLPVLGFTDVFFMRYSLVADHYQHLAMIAVVAVIAAGWAAWQAHPARARAAEVAAFLAVGGLMALTWRQNETYHDEETLYRATLARSPESWMVYNNLGLLESAAGRKAVARADYEEALRLNPHFAEAYLNRGELALDAGALEAAIADFRRALQEKPRNPEAHYNLGNALHGLGREGEAVAEYEAALALRPTYAEAENNLGVALAALGRSPDALRHYRRAIGLNPDYPEVRYNLANLLAAAGDRPGAMGQYQEALRLKPDYPEAETNLALAYEQAGRLAEAIELFQRAVAAHPDYIEARNSLGIALAIAGRPAEARAEFEEVLRRRPDYRQARQNLARLQAMGP